MWATRSRSSGSVRSDRRRCDLRGQRSGVLVPGHHGAESLQKSQRRLGRERGLILDGVRDSTEQIGVRHRHS